MTLYGDALTQIWGQGLLMDIMHRVAQPRNHWAHYQPVSSACILAGYQRLPQPFGDYLLGQYGRLLGRNDSLFPSPYPFVHCLHGRPLRGTDWRAPSVGSWGNQKMRLRINGRIQFEAHDSGTGIMGKQHVAEETDGPPVVTQCARSLMRHNWPIRMKYGWSMQVILDACCMVHEKTTEWHEYNKLFMYVMCM